MAMVVRFLLVDVRYSPVFVKTNSSPFWKLHFVFQAQGFTDEAPQVPIDIPSTNLKRLVAYAHRVLSGNDAQLYGLEDVYVALSCIVSTTVNDASNIFGSSLITRITSQVTLKEIALPILAKVLSPLQESFAKNDYDLNFLQQEVELRLAELFLCERDGRWATKEEKSGGRKTDALVLAKEVSGGEVHYIECSVNEHRPLYVGQVTLKEQSRKALRINRSILSCTGSQGTVLFIDAHGLRGKI
ncbi:hypothetical protein BGZ88_001462 [Linnemannia elongata]|nr:hypothetical protein BGZ88_001462 [Linnemannia elongata]